MSTGQPQDPLSEPLGKQNISRLVLRCVSGGADRGGRVVLGYKNETPHVGLRAGLTLIELLVVVAVIVILAGLLLAPLPGAKERSQRAVCRSTLRQLFIALKVYGDDYSDNLPPAQLPAPGQSSEQIFDEYSPVVSPQTLTQMVQYARTEAVLRCPGLSGPYDFNAIWHYSSWFQVLGYNYLGGHRGTPWETAVPTQEKWISPQNFRRPAGSIVLAELNMWSQLRDVAFAPHGPRGPLQKIGPWPPVGADSTPTSAELGAAGGHVALLDGSVAWRPAKQMRERMGASNGLQGVCLSLW